MKTMLNIIIPIAASSSASKKDFFSYPLLLKEVMGKALIEYVVDNIIKIEGPKKITFILNKEESDRFHIDNTLKLLINDCSIIKVKGKTNGAICSILMGIDKIDLDEELIIINSDQIIEFNYNQALSEFRTKKVDGGLLTFNSIHPRWSYVKTYEDKVIQTAEKNPISNNAIAGFYYFKKAKDFIEGSFKTIYCDDNLNGNFYTSSVYNQMILDNKLITCYNINKDKYFSFYSEQKLKEFEDYLKK